MDAHRDLFGGGAGGQRCDLALFGFAQNTLRVTFVEVKWRESLGDEDSTMRDVAAQTMATREAFRQRCFNPQRADTALHRAHLATVLRYHCERAARYGSLAAEEATRILAAIARLDREGVELEEPSCEGYIVCLNEMPGTEEMYGDATIRVLTRRDVQEVVTGRMTAPPGVGTVSAPPPGNDLPTAPVASVPQSTLATAPVGAPVPPCQILQNTRQ